MTVREDEPLHDAQAPAAARDLLGNVCFYHHFAVMIYIVVGWLAPLPAALVFYLVFLPGVAMQWWVNKNSCVLNNIESLMRTGRWRDPANREEGAWLATLADDVLGLKATPLQVDIFTYCVLGLLWALGVWHLRGW